MWGHFVSGLLGGLGWPAGRPRPATTARVRRSRGTWVSWAAVAAVVAALGLAVWGFWGFWRHRARPVPPELASNLDAALELAPHARPRAWTAIVLHHSGTASGSAASFDAYHRQKGWRSLGYDFVIGNGTGTPDGYIEAGPRWRNQESGAHANSNEFNAHGIGICFVGNFNETHPRPAQWEAALALVRELCRRYRIPHRRIFGHGDIREGGGTDCPGKHLSVAEFVRDL